MYRFSVCFAVGLLMMCCVLPISAQQPAAAANGVVPPMVKFSGVLTDVNSKPLTGVVGVTFSLYKDSQGGAPLWMETQNVQTYKNGHYSVMLGSTSSHGLPNNLFVSGEARWLGAQAQGQAEQPRTLLMSVPYALKAADAETLGGRPLSAFQLATPQANNGSRQSVQPAAEQPNEIRCAGSAACKTGFVPLFSSNGGSAKVSDSIINQSSGAITIAGSESVSSSNTGTAAIQATNTGTSGGFANGIRGDTNSGAASGVAGVNHSSDPNATGIYGYSNSFGIIGSSPGVGIRGASSETSGAGMGVQGLASSTGNGTAGVYGQTVTPITSNFTLHPAGVWGSTGLSGGIGVLGTVDDANAGVFMNNSPTGYWTLIAWSFDSNAPTFSAYNQSNSKGCTIDAAGNLNCDGSKNAVVPIDGGKRKVAMSAIESPENWFEDFGSAQLINGAAVIQFDRDFIQTVNTEKEYRVFPVPNSDCKGLYVTNKSANSFEVRELGGGTSNVRFDYRITAIRRKYENVRFADHTNDPDPRKMLEQMRKVKPASSSDPVSVKPASQPVAGVPVAQLMNK
ncbi:MAG TPA: hypothetical protein VN948_09135 [Terriglobales bacterium]|nr:hypothetical protein [Terriglobales bacterium]